MALGDVQTMLASGMAANGTALFPVLVEEQISGTGMAQKFVERAEAFDRRGLHSRRLRRDRDGGL